MDSRPSLVQCLEAIKHHCSNETLRWNAEQQMHEWPEHAVGFCHVCMLTAVCYSVGLSFTECDAVLRLRFNCGRFIGVLLQQMQSGADNAQQQTMLEPQCSRSFSPRIHRRLSSIVVSRSMGSKPALWDSANMPAKVHSS